jgi:hypothetical protein
MLEHIVNFYRVHWATHFCSLHKPTQFPYNRSGAIQSFFMLWMTAYSIFNPFSILIDHAFGRYIVCTPKIPM